MVRYSCKKKVGGNRKQSFKKRSVGGRNAQFIGNEMIGGNFKENIALLIDGTGGEYKTHPLNGLIRAAFSNTKCVGQGDDMECKTDGLLGLNDSYNTCVEIMKTFSHEDGDKPVPSADGSNSAEKDVSKKQTVESVIPYLYSRVFIPKDVIKTVFVQSDTDGKPWTSLTKSGFVEPVAGQTQQRDAAATSQTATAEQLEGANTEDHTPGMGDAHEETDETEEAKRAKAEKALVKLQAGVRGHASRQQTVAAKEEVAATPEAAATPP